MASDKPPIVFDEDNPEWTEEDFARARPAAEVLSPEVLAAFGKRGRGRPVGSATSNKERVSLRLDKDALERFRADGPGWQTRINDAVRKAAGL
ncbi:BrnA antitoxin family protein [Sphingomonas naphthae]|uniref:BrnA antitoxin family protein n=1 Tax=Sphingomonas naphthae TaxID=1813468 RepID=A0ABY7TQZ5_9SPHN|nr:BrnA antitoxin family protein [Sphingomonas naphthae]WCT75057.1 BrnA antitoxin family protein [Sphingomonas naphthae]